MLVDPIEHELLDISNNEVDDSDNISSLKASDQQTSWRNDLATAMYNNWLGNWVAVLLLIYILGKY